MAVIAPQTPISAKTAEYVLTTSHLSVRVSQAGLELLAHLVGFIL